MTLSHPRKSHTFLPTISKEGINGLSCLPHLLERLAAASKNLIKEQTLLLKDTLLMPKRAIGLLKFTVHPKIFFCIGAGIMSLMAFILNSEVLLASGTQVKNELLSFTNKSAEMPKISPFLKLEKCP